MIATFARQDNHHSNFDQELSNLGAKLASCHISAADNLRTMIDEVVEANRKEHESTRRHFNSTVQALTTGHANQQEARKRHEQLLDSLRYDEINLRQNEISESHSRTFGWVFEGKTRDRSDSLSSWLKHGQKCFALCYTRLPAAMRRWQRKFFVHMRVRPVSDLLGTGR